MNMAPNGVDAFLQAEEEANRLVEVLKHLKAEAESYKKAHETLDQAASGLSELSSRYTQIAERLGGLAEALRSIGTPELLRRMEVVGNQVGVLQQDLEEFQRTVIKDNEQTVERITRDVNSMRQEVLEAHQQDTAQIISQIDMLQQGIEGLQRLMVEENARAVERITGDIDSIRNAVIESHRVEIERIKRDLSEQLAVIKVAVRLVRNLAIGSIVLLIVTLAVLSWVMVSLPRG
jgi:uncharacterized phage infection (PIP) family protein YhgE